MSAVLEIKGMNKAFGGIRVADDINLSLHAGRVLGLIGPNGAGKTSLFNLVCGVVKPDSGEVYLDGAPLAGLKTFERARLGLARTWQNIRLFPSLSVFDNVLIGAKDYPGTKLTNVLFRPGFVRESAYRNLEKAHGILERCGLGDTHDKLVSDLPYGRQKLVGVARALMSDAKCLLLDEPMAGVEGQSYAAIQAVVREVAASGIAVGVVEHNVAFVRDLCDEGVFMFSGKILARGAVADLISDRQLTELYFGT
ncbi:MAG: ABC transporter ATP-binding protein [Beijerinckiaceae bacterium]|jgi:branched-chain amino acid transport system ATP-binding protein|nr:ABC transporter ATP-binding protein [Beijerinckiaceae bacterium]